MKAYNSIDKIEEAITSDKFSHTRAKKWCGVWIVYIYHSTPKNPTGVSLVIGDREEVVVPLLRKYGRTSPLSPTELR